MQPAGQPARNCRWDSWSSDFQCNGLGLVSTTEGITGSSWNALVDGNGSGKRDWPAAGDPSSSTLKMPSLCVNAEHLAGAYVHGNYIWRLPKT